MLGAGHITSGPTAWVKQYLHQLKRGLGLFFYIYQDLPTSTILLRLRLLTNKKMIATIGAAIAATISG